MRFPTLCGIVAGSVLAGWLPAAALSAGELARPVGPALPAAGPLGLMDVPESTTPSAGETPLSPQMVQLRDRVRRVLRIYYPKHQNTRDNTPWEVMHEIIAYGVNSQLYKGGPGGPKVNAIGWLCFNGPCKDEQIFYLDRGQIVARKGPGVQGHFGQFLAIVAQSHLQSDYPMLIGGKKFTLKDLIEHEKQDCRAGEELTFKLIGLMHYCKSDDTWQNREGQDWSIQRLIQEELKQPIRGAACGGTHRLMGFSYAVNKRIKRGEPVSGEFQRAQKFINDYHRYTFGLQNPDGSFSTQWFVRSRGRSGRGPAAEDHGPHPGMADVFALGRGTAREPRVVAAVDFLSGILLREPTRTWEIGPLGHGLHSLALYDARVFGNSRSAPVPLAKAPALGPVLHSLPKTTPAKTAVRTALRRSRPANRNRWSWSSASGRLAGKYRPAPSATPRKRSRLEEPMMSNSPTPLRRCGKAAANVRTMRGASRRLSENRRGLSQFSAFRGANGTLPLSEGGEFGRPVSDLRSKP